MTDLLIEKMIEEKRKKFFKKFTYIPDYEIAGATWKKYTGSQNSPNPVTAWNWINDFVREIEKETRKSVIENKG